MRRAIGKKLLSATKSEQLASATMRILNSRPLLQMEDDCNKILRPVDFLILAVLMGKTESLEHNTAAHGNQQLIKRNLLLQQCLQRLWELWQHDYICDLLNKNQIIHNQTKCSKKQPPRIGKVVFIYDANIPRAQWKLGKVVEMPHSNNNHIRTAEVQTANDRIIGRPVNYHLRDPSFP